MFNMDEDVLFKIWLEELNKELRKEQDQKIIRILRKIHSDMKDKEVE